ncbi:hypothetical protein C8Q78DRAFT_357729 [Trametes maxima]|nr:hypothetical protein C8Q78DRAFT_357729 [Trametes maxima]
MRTYGPDRTNHWKRRLPNSLKDLGRNYKVFDSRPPCRPVLAEPVPALVESTIRVPSNTAELEWRALDGPPFGKRLRKKRNAKGDLQQPCYNRDYGQVDPLPQVGVLYPSHPPSPTCMQPNPCAQAVSAPGMPSNIVKEEDCEVRLTFPPARPTLPPLASVLGRECWAPVPKGYHGRYVNYPRRHAIRKLRLREETFPSERAPPSFSPPPTAVEPPGIPYSFRDSPDSSTPPTSPPTSLSSLSSPSTSPPRPPSLPIFHSRPCAILGPTLHTSELAWVPHEAIPSPPVWGREPNGFGRPHMSVTHCPGASYIAATPVAGAVRREPSKVPGHALGSAPCSRGACFPCVSGEQDETGMPRDTSQRVAVREFNERGVSHAEWRAVENEREREAVLEFTSGSVLELCFPLTEEPLIPRSLIPTASSFPNRATFQKRRHRMMRPSRHDMPLRFSAPIIAKDERR